MLCYRDHLKRVDVAVVPDVDVAADVGFRMTVRIEVDAMPF
jgi:hypothetical protein